MRQGRTFPVITTYKPTHAPMPITKANEAAAGCTTNALTTSPLAASDAAVVYPQVGHG